MNNRPKTRQGNLLSERGLIHEIGKEFFIAAQKLFGGLETLPGKKITNLDEFRLYRLQCEKWLQLCEKFGLAVLLFFSVPKTWVDRDNSAGFASVLDYLENIYDWLLSQAKKYFDKKTVEQMFAPCSRISL